MRSHAGIGHLRGRLRDGLAVVCRLGPALVAVLVPVLLLAGGPATHPAVAATGKVSVCATVETDPTRHPGDSADDTAIWLNPTDRSRSTVIGADKLSGG